MDKNGTKIATNKSQEETKMQTHLNTCVTNEDLRGNITRLKELHRVMTLDQIIPGVKSSQWVELNLKKGSGRMKALDYQEGLISNINSAYEAGTFFEFHVHPGIELIVVYEGLVELQIDHGETIESVLVGEGHKPIYYFDAQKPHGGKMLKYTRMYGITMPPDEFWPKGL